MTQQDFLDLYMAILFGAGIGMALGAGQLTIAAIGLYIASRYWRQMRKEGG